MPPDSHYEEPRIIFSGHSQGKMEGGIWLSTCTSKQDVSAQNLRHNLSKLGKVKQLNPKESIKKNNKH